MAIFGKKPGSPDEPKGKGKPASKADEEQIKAWKAEVPLEETEEIILEAAKQQTEEIRQKEETPPPPPPKEEKVQSPQDRIKDLTDQIMRLQAEFSNFRTRTEKEKGEAIRYGKEATLERLIGLTDIMENALRHSENATDVTSFKKGLAMVIDEFVRFIKSEGAEPIKAVSEKFDPHFHEAVEQVNTQNETENNLVLEEIQKGYLINGRLLRPSLVKVAKFMKDTKEKEK